MAETLASPSRIGRLILGTKQPPERNAIPGAPSEEGIFDNQSLEGHVINEETFFVSSVHFLQFIYLWF